MWDLYRIIRRNRGIFLPPSPLFHSLHLLGETTICRRRPREYRLMAYERANVKLRREWRPFGIQARNSPPSSLNLAGFRWIIRAVPRITSLYSWHGRIRLCAPRIFAFHTPPSWHGWIGEGSRRAILDGEREWEQLIPRDTARFCTECPAVFNHEFFNQFRTFFSPLPRQKRWNIRGSWIKSYSASKLGAVLHLQFCY